MRVDKRAHEVSLLQTKLEIEIWEYFHGRDLDNVEELRALAMEIREILLGMEPKVEHAETTSALKDLIRDYQAKHELTDIEILQPLLGLCSSSLKYMLRYERHGNYDTPAMEPRKTKKGKKHA